MAGDPCDGTCGSGLEPPPWVPYVVKEPPVDVDVEAEVGLCHPCRSVGASEFPRKLPNGSFRKVVDLGLWGIGFSEAGQFS